MVADVRPRSHSLRGPCILALGAAGLFGVIALQVNLGPIGADVAFLRWLESIRDPRWTAVMVEVTELGGTLGTAAVMTVAVLGLSLSRHRRAALYVLVTYVGSVLITRAAKVAFARPRPSSEIVTAITEARSFSFPSGHALGTMVLYGSLVIAAMAIGNRRATRLSVALAAVVIPWVGVSRCYLGVHFGSDVVAGWALGLAWLNLTLLLERWALTRRVPPA
ncbi:MAG: phosphatase PAP2 family protein [Myxococcota bacterium]